jgi:alkylhydroperoxidase family enzyme
MIIDIPEGREPIGYVWGEMAPGIGMAAATFSMSVYEHTTLGLREFEAARLRVAQINGCLFWRDALRLAILHDEVTHATFLTFDRVQQVLLSIAWQVTRNLVVTSRLRPT